MISLVNISKTYYRHGSGVHIAALKDLSFDIPDNKITVVVGPSGCGKTTLLNIISNLERSFEGKVHLHNSQYKIGYMFQTPSLIPWRTVWGNIGIGCEIEGVSQELFGPKAQLLLNRYGLAEFAQEYPHSLSQGMQQRVAFIRLLLFGANLLLLDEPFSRLDYVTRRTLYSDLHSIVSERDVSILAVTHDIEEAVILADKIIILSPRPGRVVGEVQIPLDRSQRIDETPDMLKEIAFYLTKVRMNLEAAGEVSSLLKDELPSNE